MDNLPCSFVINITYLLLLWVIGQIWLCINFKNLTLTHFGEKMQYKNLMMVSHSMTAYSNTALWNVSLRYRSVLGPDLIILVLSMTSEERRNRVLLRHDGDVSSADKMDVSPVMKIELENTFWVVTAVCKPHGAGWEGWAEDDWDPRDKFND